MLLNVIARAGFALFALIVLGVTMLRDGSIASTSAAAAPTPVPVTIRDFAFKPATVYVSVGATVQWTNKDEIGHTATSADSSALKFDSGNLDQGQSYSFTFKKAGTYEYVCTYHPNMTGKVVVTALSSAH